MEELNCCIEIAMLVSPLQTFDAGEYDWFHILRLCKLFVLGLSSLAFRLLNSRASAPILGWSLGWRAVLAHDLRQTCIPLL